MTFRGIPLPLPPQSELLDKFEYNPETGVLLHRRGIRQGLRAGSTTIRRSQVRVNHKLYTTARIIWRMVTGKDPGELEVDHKDCDVFNDKWDNLRLATKVQNRHNTRNRKRSRSGAVGVYPVKRKDGTICYQTFWTSSNGTKNCKTFETLEEAIRYKDEEEYKHWGEFALPSLREPSGPYLIPTSNPRASRPQ